MELFTSTDSGLTLADGIPVMECSQADFQILTPSAGRPDIRILEIRIGDSEPASIRLMSSPEGGE